MKKILFLFLVFVSLRVNAQQDTLFVAAREGLSFREQPGFTSKLIDKIPYGSAVAVLTMEEEWVPVQAEGMRGFWQKIKYKNKTGYVADIYLLPLPPPKTGIREISAYFSQVSAPFGNKLVIKPRKQGVEIDEISWQLEKQLYRNGTEWHHFMGYEYGSNTYFLPDFTLQQAFVLLRLIPEFKEVFNTGDPFPAESNTFKKDQREYKLVVEKEDYGGDTPWIKKISLEFEDGAIYNFELYQIDNQAVIFFGSGV